MNRDPKNVAKHGKGAKDQLPQACRVPFGGGDEKRLSPSDETLLHWVESIWVPRGLNLCSRAQWPSRAFKLGKEDLLLRAHFRAVRCSTQYSLFAGKGGDTWRDADKRPKNCGGLPSTSVPWEHSTPNPGRSHSS